MFAEILFLFSFLSVPFFLFSSVEVLYKYYPEVVATCPSVGRQGKALRRRKKREGTVSLQCHEDKLEASQSGMRW